MPSADKAILSGVYPKPSSPLDREYEGQAHYMAKAAHSLVNLLNGLDYAQFDLERVARITARIHGLINYIDALTNEDATRQAHEVADRLLGRERFTVKHPDGSMVNVIIPGRD